MYLQSDASLDINVQIGPLPWTHKQKRAYHRVMSGLTHYRRQGEFIRFMTLTTSLEGDGSRLQKSWSVLRKRIYRRFGSFDYIMFRTNEGSGVLHILFVGPYLPQRWLSEQWSDIHKSKIVDIRVLKGKNRGIAGYLVGKYCSGQVFIRYSLSRNWVFRGFVGYWQMLKKYARQVWIDEGFYMRWHRFRRYLLAVWRAILCERSPPSDLYACCFTVGMGDDE